MNWCMFLGALFVVHRTFFTDPHMYIWQCLLCIRHNEYVILGYHHIFSLRNIDFRYFVARFEVRDHCGDVGHHLPSFIQKYTMFDTCLVIGSVWIFVKSAICPTFVH
jgi:hypothetical protein